jgi:hypothetical protein
MRTLSTLLCSLLVASFAHAGPVKMQWNAGTGPGLPVQNYQMQRCTPPTGQTTCAPSVDVPNGTTLPTVTLWTDTTGTPGTTYCWTVFAVAEDGSRKQVTPGADGKPYVCTATPWQLPPAGPTTVQPLPVGLRLTWLPPTYTGTDATAAMLTRYDVWRRPNPGTAWTSVGSVGPTILTWDDLAATTDLAPGFCYEIRAVYNPIASVGNGMVCATATPPAPPTVPPAPTNLRFAP